MNSGSFERRQKIHLCRVIKTRDERGGGRGREGAGSERIAVNRGAVAFRSDRNTSQTQRSILL